MSDATTVPIKIIDGATADVIVLESVRALLLAGKKARLTVRGQSMRPWIRDGAVVTVRPRAEHEPQIGDTVLFLVPCAENPRGFVVHRIVGKKPAGRFIARGDGVAVSDPPIAREQIIGIVESVASDGQTVLVNSLRARFFRTFFLHLPGVIAVLRKIVARARALVGSARLGAENEPGFYEKILLRLIERNVAPEAGTALVACREFPELYALTAASMPALAGDVAVGEARVRAAWQSAQTEAATKWLAARLDEAGIRGLLAGAAGLAPLLYKNPGERLGADVDLLVSGRDVRRLVRFLLSRGCVPAEPERDLDYYVRFRNEVALFFPARHWPVLEIHWHPAGLRYFARHDTIEDFFAGARPVFGSRHLCNMSPENHFAYALGHLAKHLDYVRPVWLLDILRLWRGLDNRKRAITRLVKNRLALPAGIVFRRIERIFPGTFPEATLAVLRPRRGPRGFFERVLVGGKSAGRRLLADAPFLETTRDAFALTYSVLFPGRDVMEKMFPAHAGDPTVLLLARRYLRKRLE